MCRASTDARTIVATGSRPRPLPWPALTAPEVLDGAVLPDGPVLLEDPVGGPVAVALAERLAARGVQACDAEIVVLATGALPVRPAWADHSVVDATDVLSGRARPQGRVLVVDELGTSHATSTAELLAGRGCAVTTVTAAMVAAQHLSATLALPGWRRRASALGVVERTDLVVQGCADGVVTLLHHPPRTSGTGVFDAVVHCGPAAPDDLLWRALQGVPGVRRIGDCLAARDAHAAISEGERAGLAV